MGLSNAWFMSKGVIKANKGAQGVHWKALVWCKLSWHVRIVYSFLACTANRSKQQRG